MESVVAARGEVGGDIDEVANAAYLGGENDLVFAQAEVLGGLGGLECADDHGLHHYVARRLWIGLLVVLVHHAGAERLIERAPVDADAYRLLVLGGALN